MLIQAPCRRLFLLRGHKLRSHTEIQIARKPGSLEGEFDHFLQISRRSQFLNGHCYVTAFHLESI